MSAVAPDRRSAPGSVTAPLGVLIMAYGGPSSLDEIPGYLADIRAGRPTSREVLEEITGNYEAIGGCSPLPEISRRQVEAVQARLDPSRFRCYLGMRHWAPWIEEVVGEMVEDGITHAVSLVLAPHYSALSIAKYGDRIAAGLDMYRGDIAFAHVESYHDRPGLIEALAARVQDGVSRWPSAEQERVHVIFSAHSLPERIVAMGDPYERQLRETAGLVAERARLGRERWSWSFQSAGRTPEPWLGPQIEDHVADLAAAGVTDIVSVPVGFVSDHVEILFDIDVKARAVAERHGVRLERPPALNDDPLFMAALAEVIEEHAAPWLAALR
jgi:protoporphyrin/coproporphyrin ferrochelatase